MNVMLSSNLCCAGLWLPPGGVTPGTCSQFVFCVRRGWCHRDAPQEGGWLEWDLAPLGVEYLGGGWPGWDVALFVHPMQNTLHRAAWESTTGPGWALSPLLRWTWAGTSVEGPCGLCTLPSLAVPLTQRCEPWVALQPPWGSLWWPCSPL